MSDMCWESRGPWLLRHTELGQIDLSNLDEAAVELADHKVREGWRAIRSLEPLEETEQGRTLFEAQWNLGSPLHGSFSLLRLTATRGL